MFKKKTVEKKNSSPKKSTRTKTQTKETTDYIKQKQISSPEYQYIANEDHYEKVIEKIKDCKKTLWIGTADIKDLYFKRRSWLKASAGSSF
ncbi:MAG: hypothetical protein K6G09_05360 [Treponema sp.]|nr:hypothetical protein [Treponema sp.]